MSELEEDIEHCEEVLADWHGCDECKADHERLLSYMKELLEYRKSIMSDKKYDGMSGVLRCMKIDKSIREILSDEEAQKNHYLQSLEFRNRIISMYREGLKDIEAYLNEHASEHDGYRIRLDVSEIVRDVEKAIDKAGEL